MEMDSIEVLFCKVCELEFDCTKDLFEHLINLHEELLNSCRFCTRYFFGYEEFKTHKNKHFIHDANMFKCAICKSAFFNKEKLFEHQFKHNLINSYEEGFSLSLILARVVVPNKDSGQMISCLNCDGVFKSYKLFSCHKNNGHCSFVDVAKTNIYNNNEIDTHEVNIWDSLEENREKIQEKLSNEENDFEIDSDTDPIAEFLNLNNRNSKKDLKLESCVASNENNSSDSVKRGFDENIRNKNAMEEQLNVVQIEHNYLSNNYNMDNSYTDKEGITYDVDDPLSENVSVITKNKTLNMLTCPYCGRMFSKEIFLNKHLSSHLNKEMNYKYVCKYCSKRFPTPTNLFGHFRKKHKMEKPFLCQICDTGFYTRPSFSEHILTSHKNDGSFKFTTDFSIVFDKKLSKKQTETNDKLSNKERTNDSVIGIVKNDKINDLLTNKCNEQLNGFEDVYIQSLNARKNRQIVENKKTKEISQVTNRIREKNINDCTLKINEKNRTVEINEDSTETEFSDINLENKCTVRIPNNNQVFVEEISEKLTERKQSQIDCVIDGKMYLEHENLVKIDEGNVNVIEESATFNQSEITSIVETGYDGADETGCKKSTDADELSDELQDDLEVEYLESSYESMPEFEFLNVKKKQNKTKVVKFRHCYICDKKVQVTNMKRHLKWHGNQKKRRKCHFCAKKFTNMSHFHLHVKRHFEKDQFLCICGVKLSSKELFEEHKRTVHSKNDSDTSLLIIKGDEEMYEKSFQFLIMDQEMKYNSFRLKSNESFAENVTKNDKSPVDNLSGKLRIFKDEQKNVLPFKNIQNGGKDKMSIIIKKITPEEAQAKSRLSIKVSSVKFEEEQQPKRPFTIHSKYVSPVSEFISNTRETTAVSNVILKKVLPFEKTEVIDNSNIVIEENSKSNSKNIKPGLYRPKKRVYLKTKHSVNRNDTELFQKIKLVSSNPLAHLISEDALADDGPNVKKGKEYDYFSIIKKSLMDVAFSENE